MKRKAKLSSAWVKNQIWSPDEQQEPIPFEIFSMGSKFQQVNQPENKFSFGSASLERLLEDDEIKAYLEKQVDFRFKKRLFETLQRLAPQVTLNDKNIESLTASELEELIRNQESELVGSLHETSQQLQEQAQRNEQIWTELVDTFMQDRAQKLSEHEGQWKWALGHIVEKMHFAGGEKKLEQITSWLHEKVSYFNESQKVNVYLSPVDLDLLSKQSEQPTESLRWKFFADENLRPGVIRLEVDHAGLIFDPEKNLKDLMTILEQN